MNQYLPHVDGLRAVAVIVVILYHLGVPEASGGFVGVDVFFVISGFLITGIIRKDIEEGTFSFQDFYLRRIRRIVPALLATCLASSLVAVLFFAPDHLKRFGESLIAAVASVSNILFWTETGYFDAAGELKPLLHTWSLGVEEQFYLLWPAALVLLAKGPRTLTQLAAVVLAAASIVLAEVWLSVDRSAAFYLLPFRFGELAIGAALTWLPRRFPVPTWIESVGQIIGQITGLGLIFYTVNFYTWRTPFPGFAALLPCLGAALVIACRPSGMARCLLENKLIVGIGRMSYSLYLVHWPVIVFWGYYTFSPLTPADQLGAATLTVAGAVLLYMYVERPFRRKDAHQWRIPTKSMASLSAAGAAVMLGAGVTAVASNGALITRPVTQTALDASFKKFQQSGIQWVDADSADILLIGDSHADHYTEAILQLAHEAGKTVTRSVMPGCPPLMNPVRSIKVAAPDPVEVECLKQMHRWAQEIRDFPGETIVLAAKWAALTEPSHYGPYRAKRHWLFVDPTDRHDIEGPRQRFAVSIASTVTQILQSNKRVVILGQVPETGIDLSSCFSAPRLLLPSPEERCISVSSQEMVDRLNFQEAVFSSIESAHPGDVEFFAVSPALCPQKVCSIHVDGELLYRNEDHISPRASVYLAGKMGEVRLFLSMSSGSSSSAM